MNIDVVITWVDGADPAHEQNRLSWMARTDRPLHANGVNPHRWADSDELGYCLRSIAKNAPWVDRIWIVTDGQTPRLEGLAPEFVAKIAIVDHTAIFRDHLGVLPTFNSLSIETMLWRIDGLAEHFLYFNDDVFITAPVQPGDFFDQGGPVLRGEWVDYSELEASDTKKKHAAFLNDFNQMKSAGILGYATDRAFQGAHVIHPMLRSVMADLFCEHEALFVSNIAHRFRCTEQFLPQSLHNHACFKSGSATLLEGLDHLDLGVAAFEFLSADQVQALFQRAATAQIKFICVNDLPAVERSFPDARRWIEHAIGLG
jgi:hypothetical protein